MKRTVLITGGSGLLALNWAVASRNRYSVVLGLHNRRVALAGVETRQIDLESVDHLVRTFETVRPQIVIHTAGLTNVEECEARPGLAQHVNVDLATNVAQACATLGVSLAHISTDHLFSGDAALMDETNPVAPQNVYGRTKAEAEAGVLKAHAGALVIRTNFYGWGPSYRRSFSDVILGALRSEKELNLFKDVFYTPILIETAVQAIHDLIGFKSTGIFHVVGDDRISKYEFGLKIAEGFNLPPDSIKPGFLADRHELVRRPLDMSLSNRKACRVLGRKLGGIDEHIARLLGQEQTGVVKEIQAL
ncbi:MAG: SDR family oxidoreductase [Nitrospiraceae bacterium]